MAEFFGFTEDEVKDLCTQYKRNFQEAQAWYDGYELVAEVSKVVNVKEGTIYPILKRLTNEHYFETYLRESTEGPPRKYYHLTAAGILHLRELEKEWEEFSRNVNKFLKER